MNGSGEGGARLDIQQQRGRREGGQRKDEGTTHDQISLWVPVAQATGRTGTAALIISAAKTTAPKIEAIWVWALAIRNMAIFPFDAGQRTIRRPMPTASQGSCQFWLLLFYRCLALRGY
jgi:hypothetical protein